MYSPLVPRNGNQQYGTVGVRSFLLDKTSVQHFLVEKSSKLRLPQSVPMGRTWCKSGVQKGSSLCAETFPSAPKFVDPQDVDFAIPDLLKGRHIGVYQDPAPEDEEFLSRSRVHTPPGKDKQPVMPWCTCTSTVNSLHNCTCSASAVHVHFF